VTLDPSTLTWNAARRTPHRQQPGHRLRRQIPDRGQVPSGPTPGSRGSIAIRVVRGENAKPERDGGDVGEVLFFFPIVQHEVMMFAPCVRDFVRKDAGRCLGIAELPDMQAEECAAIADAGAPPRGSRVPGRLLFSLVPGGLKSGEGEGELTPSRLGGKSPCVAIGTSG